ncbi:MAG: MoxR-like ATPases [uncultured Sulfurovum sp.]|uniref:MoxR-like ATPases n=1 Tax=uncultured Sulfurovum sp. TaxID=269237 RepID=A0A6S6TCM6_9BACT|nr:MAG: MoxR-like ATPases [uncultured Sulfurovum sp.]
MANTDWCYFQGDSEQKEFKAPTAPPWRIRKNRVKSYCTFSDKVKKMVSAALILRRPLLITGNPGIGKSSLAEAVMHELKLGDEVLYWRIGTQSKLKDGLYSYDALSRLQDVQTGEEDSEGEKISKKIENYLKLEALGTAFTSKTQRVVLIDEIDKSPIDLPNNLLHIFEENEFEIPELKRLKNYSFDNGEGFHTIDNGLVKCDIDTFPLIIMTSNGERDFPMAFMRRCLHLELKDPTDKELAKIVNKHFEQIKVKLDQEKLEKIIRSFIKLRDSEENKVYLSTDQLLNAVYLMEQDESIDLTNADDEMIDGIWKNLLG